MCDGPEGWVDYVDAADAVLAELGLTQAALLTNPYTGTPRDYRDVESDPAGVLIQEPGAPLRAAKPRKQDFALVQDAMEFDWVTLEQYEAWQRIRALVAP